MSKKGILLFAGLGILALIIGFAIGYQVQSRLEWITFEACANAGGEAWQVDIYHPDICPACAEYQACEHAYNDYREVCPECYEACPECTSCIECKQENKKYTDIREVCPQILTCTECQKENFPYPDKCPGGKENIGKISDAAIWFQCCK